MLCWKLLRWCILKVIFLEKNKNKVLCTHIIFRFVEFVLSTIVIQTKFKINIWLIEKLVWNQQNLIYKTQASYYVCLLSVLCSYYRCSSPTFYLLVVICLIWRTSSSVLDNVVLEMDDVWLSGIMCIYFTWINSYGAI